ncbi:interleukin-20 receptor subunit alpha isoform X3 [Choloepus didactylus]|uniref:interleukin-20 receptor subunit alpha isoform X3 n=1 Tax=Choloepus didactylus TaxID=27675 RepID=UPI00189FD880|nr:interleukin-20 receptor subunit alpha isoform X3 [Choloepus didactylus]
MGAPRPSEGAPRRPTLLLPPPLLLLLAAPWGRAGTGSGPGIGPTVPCGLGVLPKPTNITFSSINMKNVLQWNPPEGLKGVEVIYTVQYFIRYGQKKWLNKSECRNISRTSCDLSAETADYEHQYYAKVKAIWKTNCSKWAETGRFYPYLETQIGPPAVALTTDEKSITIVLKAPEKWKRNPEDSSVSMQQIYSDLKYKVSVYNTKSNRTWSQCVSNHTLVLSWLEADTLYCVHVESFLPGPPRRARPSEKQCVHTLKDQASAWKIKIIFLYVLPISISMFIFSVMGYLMYRYTHVGKEKHPANLILIYGNGLDNRFFVTAEKVMFNFVTLNIVDDSKVSETGISLTEESGAVAGREEAGPSGGQDPRLEEVEVKHLGYASHEMEVLLEDISATQQESLSGNSPVDNTVIGYEYDMRTSICVGPEDQELHRPDEVSIQGKLFERRAAAAAAGPQAFLSSYTPQLGHLEPLAQDHTDTEEGPQEDALTTLVDWDPRTGRLCMPSLSSCEHDVEGLEPSEEWCGLPAGGLLSRLYEEPAPDEPPEENESYLLQFMEEWGLYVQMGD